MKMADEGTGGFGVCGVHYAGFTAGFTRGFTGVCAGAN